MAKGAFFKILVPRLIYDEIERWFGKEFTALYYMYYSDVRY